MHKKYLAPLGKEGEGGGTSGAGERKNVPRYVRIYFIPIPGVALGDGEATASLSSAPRYEYEDGGEGPQPPPLPPDDAYADYGEGEAAAGMDEAMVMYQLRFALEGVLMAVIANAGIFGNLVSAFILLRRRLDLQPFLCRWQNLEKRLRLFHLVFALTTYPFQAPGSPGGLRHGVPGRRLPHLQSPPALPVVRRQPEPGQ